MHPLSFAPYINVYVYELKRLVLKLGGTTCLVDSSQVPAFAGAWAFYLEVKYV